MALLDISKVTTTVINLITEAFNTSSAWTAMGGPPGIYPDPPETVDDGVAFYLYHMQENGQFKNLPSPGKDRPPVRYTPMALNLYYILSANKPDQGVTNPSYIEQTMMGIAIKALHDYPEIDDSTSIGGVTIMDATIVGMYNRFRISLQPIPYNEAVHYWTAGSSSLKLAAYYEITAILLDPEPIQTYAGRVLTYGTFVYPAGGPQITSSKNTLSFTLPGGTTPTKILVQPAQVAVGSTVIFTGSGFSGDQLDVLLYSSSWTGSLVADASWNPSFTGADQLALTIPPSVNAGAINIVPGVYSVQIRAIRQFTLSNGAATTVQSLSNQMPFTVTPRVDNSGADAGNVIPITGYIFQDPLIQAGNIDVYMGETRLGTGAPAPFFTVANPTTIQITVDPATQSGQTFPLRVLVTGVESPPFWIVVP